MVANKAKIRRELLSELFTKEVQHNSKTYLQPWRRYHFSVPLNHGLARTTDCLPADIPIQIRFHRAPASFALMKMSNEIELRLKSDQAQKVNVVLNFEESVIPIVNPVLSAYYAYSNELEQMMSKVRLYNLEIPFLDYVVRRTVLDSGLSQYDVTLMQGRMPKYVIMGLTTLERLSGNEGLSITKFTQNDLISFDIKLGLYEK